MKYLEHHSEAFAATLEALVLTIVGFGIGFAVTLAIIATYAGMVRW